MPRPDLSKSLKGSPPEVSFLPSLPWIDQAPFPAACSVFTPAVAPSAVSGAVSNSSKQAAPQTEPQPQSAPQTEPQVETEIALRAPKTTDPDPADSGTEEELYSRMARPDPPDQPFRHDPSVPKPGSSTALPGLAWHGNMYAEDPQYHPDGLPSHQAPEHEDFKGEGLFLLVLGSLSSEVWLSALLSRGLLAGQRPLQLAAPAAPPRSPLPPSPSTR